MENKTIEAIMYIVPKTPQRLCNYVMSPQIRQMLAQANITGLRRDEIMLTVVTKSEDNPEWGLHGNPIDGGTWSDYFPAYLFKDKKEGDVIELVYSDKINVPRSSAIIKITLQQQGSPYDYKGSFEKVLKQIGIIHEK